MTPECLRIHSVFTPHVLPITPAMQVSDELVGVDGERVIGLQEMSAHIAIT